MRPKKLFNVFLFPACILFLQQAHASPEFGQAVRSEVFVHRNTEWVNYQLLLGRAGSSQTHLIRLSDILLQPRLSPDLVLHQELLESLYRDNRRNVFFVAELTPYYPETKYRRVPWLAPADYFFFGNAFWHSDSWIKDAFNRAYGSSGSDFNSTMRRVERYIGSDVKPQTIVFARLDRTGSDTQWRNAWGWTQYYYFTGRYTYTPRGD